MVRKPPHHPRGPQTPPSKIFTSIFISLARNRKTKFPHNSENQRLSDDRVEIQLLGVRRERWRRGGGFGESGLCGFGDGCSRCGCGSEGMRWVGSLGRVSGLEEKLDCEEL